MFLLATLPSLFLSSCKAGLRASAGYGKDASYPARRLTCAMWGVGVGVDNPF